MVLHQAGAPGRLRADGRLRDLVRLDERGERHLRVDRDALALGQAHHEVGPPGAVLGRAADLQVEVDAVRQAGALHQAAQLDLAPRAAHRVVPERGGERLRGVPHLVGGGAGGEQLLLDGAVLGGALLLELVDLALHRAQRLLHGGERREHAGLLLLPPPAVLRLGGARGPVLLRPSLGGTELTLQPVDRRLVRRELGAQVRRDRLALGAGAQQVGLVPSGDHRRVLPPARACGTEQGSDQESDDESADREQCFHAWMARASAAPAARVG